MLEIVAIFINSIALIFIVVQIHRTNVQIKKTDIQINQMQLAQLKKDMNKLDIIKYEIETDKKIIEDIKSSNIFTKRKNKIDYPKNEKKYLSIYHDLNKVHNLPDNMPLTRMSLVHNSFDSGILFSSGLSPTIINELSSFFIKIKLINSLNMDAKNSAFSIANNTDITDSNRKLIIKRIKYANNYLQKGYFDKTIPQANKLIDNVTKYRMIVSQQVIDLEEYLDN